MRSCPNACERWWRGLRGRAAGAPRSPAPPPPPPPCIPSLTIELECSIPLDLRPALGDWLFGCDVCQEVCPWNRRFAGPTADPDFQPLGMLRQPAAAPLLALDGGAFRRGFQGSAVRRAPRRGRPRHAAGG